MSERRPDYFWMKVNGGEWEIGARLSTDEKVVWWRWGSRWPLKDSAVTDIEPQISRP